MTGNIDSNRKIEQLQGENRLLRHQQANARRASENTRCSGCGEVLDGDEPIKFLCPLCVGEDLTSAFNAMRSRFQAIYGGLPDFANRTAGQNDAFTAFCKTLLDWYAKDPATRASHEQSIRVAARLFGDD